MSLDSLVSPHKRWMKSALREGRIAFDNKEVPVGAVVVLKNVIVGRGRNMVETLGDPTAHAEMIALTAATQTLGTKHLNGCTLYVTLEPCPMCAGALVLSRIDRLVFGALDEKAGAASTLYNITEDPRLNHQLEVIAGIDADLSADLLSSFFKKLR